MSTLTQDTAICLIWTLIIAVHSFQDGQEQSLGPEDFMTMLHEAGANQRLATEAWLSNCYCWTIWKLAAYEQTYPEQLQGKLLTKDVVLDQLKYRSVAASIAWHRYCENQQTEQNRCGLCAHSSLLLVGSSMQMYLLEKAMVAITCWLGGLPTSKLRSGSFAAMHLF